MALSTRSRYLITGPILFLVGVVLGLIGLGEYKVSAGLKAVGIEVPGEIIDGKVTTGRRNAKTYYVTARYEVKPGAGPAQREFKVSKGLFERTTEDPKVQVRVNPNDPKVAEIVGEESNGYFIMGLGAFCFLASLFMISQVFKRDTPLEVISLA